MWGWTLHYALIHRSAWNMNSANFALKPSEKGALGSDSLL